jgi:hypothetical protein
MAKSKSSKKSKDAKQDKQAKEQEQAKKAEAKTQAKAAAKLALLVEDAKKTRKAADKAARTADKAQVKAVEAGAPAPKSTPSEADLLKLALRTSEAKLTDAERKVEALEQQIADLHARDELEVEETIEDAIVDLAVAATVEDALVDADVVADGTTTDAEEAEAIAVELDEIISEAEAAPEEPSHDGEAESAAEAFEQSDASAEPTVTTSELTPPLPDKPAGDEPSESWTLLQLRAAAKARGLTGTSNLPKAKLLDRLRSA